MKKEVIAHLKGDIKGFKKEASEDRALIKKLKHKKHEAKESKKHEKSEHKKRSSKKKHVKKSAKKKLHVTPKREKKISKVMREFKGKKLHSSSKNGPLVKNKRQALAIALSEARKA